jgi:hypothetical protein
VRRVNCEQREGARVVIILTNTLPAEQVPLVGLGDRQAADMLLEALAFTIGDVVRDQDNPSHAEFIELARKFAAGKHVVFVTMHAEEQLVRAPAKKSGLLSRLKGDK